MVVGHRRRGSGVGSPPDEHLVRAVLLHRLGLVETCGAREEGGGKRREEARHARGDAGGKANTEKHAGRILSAEPSGSRT